MCNICNKPTKKCSCHSKSNCGTLELKTSSVIYDGPNLPRLGIVTGDSLTSALYDSETVLEDVYNQLDVAKKEVVIITDDTTLDISHNGKIIYVASNINVTIPLDLIKNTQFTFDTNTGFTLSVAPGVAVSGNMLPLPYAVTANTDIFAYFTATNQMRLKKLS